MIYVIVPALLRGIKKAIVQSTNRLRGIWATDICGMRCVSHCNMLMFPAQLFHLQKNGPMSELMKAPWSWRPRPYSPLRRRSCLFKVVIVCKHDSGGASLKRVVLNATYNCDRGEENPLSNRVLPFGESHSSQLFDGFSRKNVTKLFSVSTVNSLQNRQMTQ